MTTLRQIYNEAQSTTPAANLLSIPASADLADIFTEYGIIQMENKGQMPQ